MMRFLLVLVLAAVSLAVGIRSSPAVLASTSWRFACPAPVSERLAVRSAYARPETVLRAVRRLVPHEYHNLRSMGDPAWPGFWVQGLRSMRNSLHRPRISH